MSNMNPIWVLFKLILDIETMDSHYNSSWTYVYSLPNPKFSLALFISITSLFSRGMLITLLLDSYYLGVMQLMEEALWVPVVWGVIWEQKLLAGN